MKEHEPMSSDSHADHDFTGPLSPPVKKLLRIFFVISALLFLADFVIHRHTYHEAEKLPGFYAIYGFVGCVVLVLVAKQMRKVVMRPESYYDPAPVESEGGAGHDPVGESSETATQPEGGSQ